MFGFSIREWQQGARVRLASESCLHCHNVAHLQGWPTWRLAALSGNVMRVSVEKARRASVTDMVPMAEERRPEKGNTSGPREHCGGRLQHVYTWYDSVYTYEYILSVRWCAKSASVSPWAVGRCSCNTRVTLGLHLLHLLNQPES